MVTVPLPTSLGLALPPDETTAWAVPVALAVACLGLGIIGSHAGTSLLVYSPTKLARSEKLREGGGRRVAEQLQEHAREYAVAAWTLALGGLVGLFPLLAMVADPSWPALLIGTIVVVISCVSMPIALADSHAERIVVATLPVLKLVRALLHYPFLAPVLGVTHALMRVLRIPDEPPTPEEIADEIMDAVTDSAAENALEEEERNWIENIVELKDLRVSEAMTPRTDIVALEADLPLREAAQRATETGYSRYPVYEEKVDKIVGVFHAKDALARLSNGPSKEVSLREVMRKPLFVPESMGVRELLGQFKGKKLQMAIVLDEYGGTAGLISIEDILEEIVGDISDEFDVEEEEPIVVTSDARIVELSGRARVDEVNEMVGCDIEENPEYDTVAGFVFTKLGKIPAKGEVVELDGLEIEILESDDRRINRMRLTLPEVVAPEEG